MYVSLNWLKQYVDYGSLSPEELAEKITKSGIEVDGIERVINEESEGIVVGYVKECGAHPNADKLRLCQVDVGETDPLQIICGAPNVATGQKVVVAKPGAVLPGNFKIKKVKLRGIESNGMICSLKELGVKEQFIPAQMEEGIIELADDTVVGEPVEQLLNLDDVILEFDLTPNRADALSMLGVAYEVAAILDTEVKLPAPTYEETAKRAEDFVRVDVEDPDLCSYYSAFIIEDVKIAPSPLWMQNYLLAAGTRPINNVVDITNYVLLEYGQPLHAFDYDLVNSKEIIVRRATEQETIVTLDEATRTLTPENLLITDGKKAIALAGVMGGAETEVHDGTTTVLLEAAFFHPQAVRKTVRDTGLRSEASTRFEKGVDPNRVEEAGKRACELFVQYAGGEVASGNPTFDQLDRAEKKLSMNAVEVNRRLGTAISLTEMEDILRKLRIAYTLVGEDFELSIPTRRGDITIFEDMLEEVARIYGYDHLPYTLPANESKAGALSSEQLLKRRIKQYLQSAGLSEVITYSLVDKEAVATFISPEQSSELQPVELAMPMSEDHQYLRLSLLPELLARLTYNVARKQNNLAIYEAGSVFLTEEKTLTSQPNEQLRLSGAITGDWMLHPWQGERKQVDFYVVKGIMEGLFRYINRHITFEQATLSEMHPGRCAIMKVDGNTIGFLGQVHPAYAKTHDLKDTYVFDLDLAYLLKTTQIEHRYTPIAKYPSILRDVAFVVEQEVAAGAIKKEIERIGAPLVKRVEAFDVYTGDTIGEHEKSIAFNIHYQDPEKTLTDKEVEENFNKVIEEINNIFDAHVRS